MIAPTLGVRNGVATVTLHDPDGVNALDGRRLKLIREAVEEALRRRDVAALHLRTDARAFSAGGDVKWFAELGAGAHDGIRDLADDGIALVRALHEAPVVTIAEVHGAVAGGGLGVMLAHDLVVAAEDTTFTTAYARLGGSPDLGVSFFLARDAGYRRALELCLLAEPFDAATALELGLVSRVVGRDELAAEAAALAARVAAGPRAAHPVTKRLVRAAAARALEHQLEDELRSIADLSLTPDWREGVSAFVQRREPRFGAGG